MIDEVVIFSLYSIALFGMGILVGIAWINMVGDYDGRFK